MYVDKHLLTLNLNVCDNNNNDKRQKYIKMKKILQHMIIDIIQIFMFKMSNLIQRFF